MNLSYHIIQQQVFDIHFKRKEKYALLQNRFSRLFHNELFPLLEAFIDKEIPHPVNFRIDTLTVDLGTVSYEHLERDIVEVFIEAFKKALHEITGDIPVAGILATAIETNTHTPDRYLEVMEFYLVTGILPWWASPEKYADPLQITDELMGNQKSDFEELLYRIGPNETVRKRLAYQFPKTYMQSIIRLLEPDKAAFIFEYHEQLGGLQEEQPFVKADTKEFEKALWLFVLDYLLVDRGSIFEERSFVKSSLYKMAMFFNVHYDELLIAFYKAVQLVHPTLKKSGGLGLIIEYVYNEHFHQPEDDKKPAFYSKDIADEKEPGAMTIESLKFYLYYGFLPRSINKSSNRNFIQYVDALITADIDKAVSLLRVAMADAATRHRLISEFPASQLIGMLKKLPGTNEAIRVYEELIELVQQSFIEELMAVDTAGNLLLLLFMEEYNAGSRSLDSKNLVIKFVKHIAGLLHTEPYIIANSFERIIHKKNEKYAASLKQALQTAGAAMNRPETAGIYHALEKSVAAQWQELFDTGNVATWGKKEMRAITNELLGFTGSGREETNIDIITWISSAVLKGKPTGRASIIQVVEKILYASVVEKSNQPYASDKLLVQLVVWLYRQKPEMVKAFAKVAAKKAPENILQLYHLLLLQNDKEAKPVFDLLRDVLQQLIPTYARQLSTTWQYNTGSTPSTQDTVLPFAALEKVLSKDVQQILQQYAARSLKETETGTVAFLLLTKLLTAGNRQDVLPGISDHEFPVLLKELMLVVFRKDAAGIKQLLEALSVSSEQFNMLYLLFSQAVTIAERSIFYVIKAVAEKKLVALIIEEAPFSDITIFRLSEAIAIMMEQNNQLFFRLLHTKEYSPLLLHLSGATVNDETIDKMLVAFQPASGHAIVFFVKEFRLLLQYLPLFSIDKAALLNNYKQFLLHFMAGKVRATDSMALVNAFFDYGEQHNKSLMGKCYVSLSALLRKTGIRDSLLSLFLPQLKQELEKRIEMHGKQGPGKENIQARNVALDSALLGQVRKVLHQQAQGSENSLQRTPDPSLQEPEIEKIYIGNAGLVLLNPFLSTYFSRLGLMENGKFINEMSKQRAIHLLAFVTDGKEEHAEHTLPLNKILCGLALKQPVDPACCITENERELTIQMLKMIFQRWEKLKNSSIEGFRDAFLKRQGMLTRTGEGWNLRVEQRGYDVLLDTIPWGFRFIKLSWMDTILTVEWM
jgi:hypothetical protein